MGFFDSIGKLFSPGVTDYSSRAAETIAGAKQRAAQTGRLDFTLVRRWFSTKSSIGEFYIYDRAYGFTLEDVTRDGTLFPPGKIYGETAIDYGTYPVLFTYSPKFGRKMPLVDKVPNYSGIRIHVGNDPADTLGCLLVGFTKAADEIKKSTPAFNQLYELIQWADANKIPMQIKVVNPQRLFSMFAAGLGLVALFFF